MEVFTGFKFSALGKQTAMPLTDGLGIGGQSSKVFGNMLLVSGGLQEPVSCSMGIGHGFLGSEGF